MQTSWSHRSKFLLVPNSPPPPLRLEHPIPFSHPELVVPTSPRAALGENGTDRGLSPPRPPNPKFCANFSELGVNFIYYILSRIQLLELGANFVQILLEFNFGYIIRIQL